MLTTKERQKSEFSERLNTLLDSLNYPPLHLGRIEVLKDAFGVSQTAARKWLFGLSMPNLSRRKTMAKTFGANYKWLESGLGDMFPMGEMDNNAQSVPYLAWDDLTDLREALSQYTGNITVNCNTLSDQSFAATVPTDDMAPIIPKGAIIIADMLAQVAHNDYVVVDVPQGPLLRQWRDDHDQLQYVISPSAPPIVMGRKDRVLGKVIQTIINL